MRSNRGYKIKLSKAQYYFTVIKMKPLMVCRLQNNFKIFQTHLEGAANVCFIS